jgi:hypothetical protein
VKQTQAQILLQKHLAELGIKTVPEFRFCLQRKFRFDLYAESLHMGFEVNGTFGGLHGPRWSASDLEKLNLAQMLGYRCMQFTNKQVERGEAKAFLAEHLRG